MIKSSVSVREWGTDQILCHSVRGLIKWSNPLPQRQMVIKSSNPLSDDWLNDQILCHSVREWGTDRILCHSVKGWGSDRILCHSVRGWGTDRILCHSVRGLPSWSNPLSQRQRIGFMIESYVTAWEDCLHERILCHSVRGWCTDQILCHSVRGLGSSSNPPSQRQRID